VSVSEIYTPIREMLARFSDDDAWLDGDDLLDGSVLDSLMAVQLVMFIERTFNVIVEDVDLELANFMSIAGMVKLIERKRGLGTA
jgi:methoxymalonate biosynthesis acyl carrier protein